MNIFEKKDKISKVKINKNNNGYNNQDNEVLLDVLKKLCELQAENKSQLDKIKKDKKIPQKQQIEYKKINLKHELRPNKSNNYTFNNIKTFDELINLCKYLAFETAKEFNNQDKIVEKGLICMYSSLISYVYFVCLKSERELNSIIELLNVMEYKNYPDYKNPVDLIFEDLEEEDPEHYALRQYIIFSHLPYELKSQLVFMANYYLNIFLAETGYKKYNNKKQRKAQIIDFTKLAKKQQQVEQKLNEELNKFKTQKQFCNICGAEILERKSKKTGKVYFICSNIKNCGKNKK